MLKEKHYKLSRAKTLGLLDKIDSMAGDAVSLYLPEGTSMNRVLNLPDGELPAAEMPANIGEIIDQSVTGAVLFWGTAGKYLVLPPFPVKQEYLASGYETAPLRAMLSQDLLIALVLVRLGSYSVGTGRGQTLIRSKTGRGLVHGRHKKGGSSQGRFVRHREKQIESFMDRVCRHAGELLEPDTRSLDYLVYGGSKTAIQALRDKCAFLSRFDGQLLPMMLDVPDPNKAVLEKALADVWSSRVFEWHAE